MGCNNKNIKKTHIYKHQLINKYDFILKKIYEKNENKYRNYKGKKIRKIIIKKNKKN